MCDFCVFYFEIELLHLFVSMLNEMRSKLLEPANDEIECAKVNVVHEHN